MRRPINVHSLLMGFMRHLIMILNIITINSILNQHEKEFKTYVLNENSKWLIENNCGRNFKAFTIIYSFNPHKYLKEACHLYPDLREEIEVQRNSGTSQSQSFRLGHNDTNSECLAQNHMVFIFFFFYWYIFLFLS